MNYLPLLIRRSKRAIFQPTVTQFILSGRSLLNIGKMKITTMPNIEKGLSVFVLISCVFLMSCRKDNSALLNKMINIEQNVKNVRPLNLCDFNCELKYIPLETTSVLLRTATLIDFIQDQILVSDRKCCFLFDSHGNFVTNIGSRGKGPGEYIHISNIGFGLQKKIIIQDIWNFLIYDYTGRIVKSFKPEANPEFGNAYGIIDSWAMFNDSLFIGVVPNDSGKEKIKAVFFNENGKTIRTISNFDFLNHQQNYTSSVNSDANIFTHDGAMFIKQPLIDTVFRITENFRFEPTLSLYLGKYQEPKEVRELPMLLAIKEGRKFILVQNLFTSSRYIFLDCDFRNNNPAKRATPMNYTDTFGNSMESLFYPVRMLGIYDKSSNELVFAEPVKSDDWVMNSGLHNDYDGGVNFYPKQMVNDSTLAMWVNAFELKLQVSSRAFKNSTPRYPEKKRELEKLAINLSENSNPVLILCTFKK